MTLHETAAKPPGPPLSQRLRPWIELISRLLAAVASAMAIWKMLG